MGALISTPKLPSMPKKSKAAPKAKPAKPAKPAKKSKGTKKSKGGRKSKYEEEPEQYANWAMALSPAAYEAVTGKIKKEKYEEEEYASETEGEEYASEGEEEFDQTLGARHQAYTPADFSSVATPLNLSVVLMILLLVLLVMMSRR